METLLWLDSIRDPYESDLFHSLSNKEEVSVVWVKNYKEFTQFLLNYSLPTLISFDHDLKEERTGYDCAKFLIDFCLNLHIPFPKWHCHSINREEKESISQLFKNYQQYERKSKI